MMVEQRALRFLCGSCWLYGVLSLPARPAPRGVLIVSGGPQYRTGSHRQHMLLAEALAGGGVAVLRFDPRGNGDSEGAPRRDGAIDDDLDSAVRHFFDAVPAMRELVLLGLDHGANAAAAYARREPRVSGLVLLNPRGAGAGCPPDRAWRRPGLGWLRAVPFWRPWAGRAAPVTAPGPASKAGNDAPQGLYEALACFRGRVLIVFGGGGDSALEFGAAQHKYAAWRRVCASPLWRQVALPHADAAFAHPRWRDEIATITADWLRCW